ncbi:MAG: carboxymuconolactone decarboxylase family protein [Steroidobacteraceae bacterium]
MADGLRAGKPEKLTGHVIRDSSLGLVPETLPAIMEMLRLRNARAVNGVFCKSMRYDIARADGLTEEKVAQIDDDYPASRLGEREKLVLAFADLYLRTPVRVDPAVAAQLRREFTPAELTHMAIGLATFHALSRCAVSLGGMPESLPVMELPGPA